MWQPVYYNLLTEKRLNIFTFLKYSFFFENVLLLSISRNSLQRSSLSHIRLENFTLSNSIILVEELISWKRCFEIFLIDLCTGDIGNNKIAGK